MCTCENLSQINEMWPVCAAGRIAIIISNARALVCFILMVMDVGLFFPVTCAERTVILIPSLFLTRVLSQPKFCVCVSRCAPPVSGNCLLAGEASAFRTQQPNWITIRLHVLNGGLVGCCSRLVKPCAPLQHFNGI